MNKTVSAFWVMCLGFSFGLAQAQPVNNSDQDPLGKFLEEHFNEPAMTVPDLSSSSALVINSKTGEVLFSKNTEKIRSIASITKLVTAMVLLDAKLPMNESITITSDDVDRLKNSGSRLSVGTTLTREQLLHLTLMSSENRAAHALARTYPGGKEAFIARMNRKVRGLGMRNTVFHDSSGLDSRNVSTASDLALAVKEAFDHYPVIRKFSTDNGLYVQNATGKNLLYKNSNVLVREGMWQINVQKTGYIREAGRCVVMHAQVGQQPLIIVLLNSSNTTARANDARTIKSWLEGTPQQWL